MQQSHALRDHALSQQAANNPATVAQFLNEIAITRRCRLRMAKTWDECFTIETLLTDIQTRCKLPAPTSLYGCIGRLAEAKRNERHANTVPEVRWCV